MVEIKVKNSKIVKVPAYLKELYGFIYGRKKVSQILDDDRVQTVLKCGFQNRLIDDLLEDVGTNSSVLQIGCTFGKQIEKTEEKIGRYGEYTIVDVDPKQLDRCREKLIDKKINFQVHDARKPFSGQYDTVICYMLLHELPEVSRQKVINNALECVKDGGKAIFIDVHMPQYWNILRPFKKWFNRLFFPFTENLWKKPIKNYAAKSNYFSWYKKTYAGSMYQKITALRQRSEQKKPDVKPSYY